MLQQRKLLFGNNIKKPWIPTKLYWE